MSLDDASIERFSRQILLHEIGPGGQRRLLGSRVLLAGLHPPVATGALYLAGAGVGCVGMVDTEAVGPGDLHAPLLFDRSALGRPRAAVAAEAIFRLNPGTSTRQFCGPQGALAAGTWDLVLCADDKAGWVDLCNSACVAAAVPLLVMHADERGAWLAIVAGSLSAAPCWACVAGTGLREPACESAGENANSFAGADELMIATAGLSATWAGMVGTLAATEGIKLLLSLPGAASGLLVTCAPSAAAPLARPLTKAPGCKLCARRPPADIGNRN